MNTHALSVSASVASLAARFGISSAISRPLDIRIDSFVGDQYLFIEILRGEVLRDVTSSAAAIMLRVSRAINNSTLSRIFDQETAAFAGIPALGKKRADIVEALVGALLIEGEYENTSRLVRTLFHRNRVPANLRYPDKKIERDNYDLGAFSLLAAEAVGMLEVRLLLGVLRPTVRDLHASSRLVVPLLENLWRGPKKTPSPTCQQIIGALSKQGVAAALKTLEIALASRERLSAAVPPDFRDTWAALQELMTPRAARWQMAEKLSAPSMT